MIEGLKICIPSDDLRSLCLSAAEYHAERMATYAQQIDNLKNAAVEGMNYTGGNPLEALTERHAEHEAEQLEMRFLAKYLKEGEEYLISREELAELGLVSSGWRGRRRRW